MTTTDRPRTGARLAVLAVSQFLVAVDFDIVFVALPQIGRGLGLSATRWWPSRGRKMTRPGAALSCGFGGNSWTTIWT